MMNNYGTMNYGIIVFFSFKICNNGKNQSHDRRDDELSHPTHECYWVFAFLVLQNIYKLSLKGVIYFSQIKKII